MVQIPLASLACVAGCLGGIAHLEGSLKK